MKRYLFILILNLVLVNCYNQNRFELKFTSGDYYIDTNICPDEKVILSKLDLDTLILIIEYYEYKSFSWVEDGWTEQCIKHQREEVYIIKQHLKTVEGVKIPAKTIPEHWEFKE